MQLNKFSYAKKFNKLIKKMQLNQKYKTKKGNCKKVKEDPDVNKMKRKC